MPRPRAMRFVKTAIVLLGCAVCWAATRQPAAAAPKMSFCAAGWQIDVVAVRAPSSGPELCPPRPDVLERLRRTGRLGALIATLRSARARGLDAPVPRLAAMPPTMKALVVLLDFSDNLAGQIAGADPSRSHYQELLDSLGAYPTGSMRDYYLEQSYGAFDFGSDVPDGTGGAIASWYRAPQTYAYYVDGQYGHGTYPRNVQKMAEDAAALADPDVDYSQYDGDGDGYVDAFAVIHAGEDAALTGDPNMVWSHKWEIPGGGYLSDEGVRVRYYMTVAENCTVAIPCHEFGHIFGLPDLYDTDQDSPGIGHWSLMSDCWLGNPMGSRPPHLDIWCKTELGWVTPIQPTEDVYGASLPPIETDPVAYRLYANGQDSDEYWLVTNRQKLGFDDYLPGAGLLIWHIDTTVPNNRDQDHRMVDLEQADGLYELNAVPGNRGDTGDPWPGSTNSRNFTNSTVPNSLTYDGRDVFVRVVNISDSADTMTADLLPVGDGFAVHQLPATGYYMISFPITPSSPTPHDLLCDDLGCGSYYMWRWQGSGYETIPTSPPGCQSTTLSMQESYWILAQGATIGMRGTQGIADQVIPLQSGWNMVAASHEAAMDSLQVDNGVEVKSLADAQAANWVLATFYGSHDGTGSYSTLTIDQTPPDRLCLWHGYWVLAGIDCSLIVPVAPPAPPTATTAAVRGLACPAWAFDIQASSGSSGDSITIAAADSASDGFDGFALDRPKPPAAPGEGRLRMVLRGKGRRGRASPPYNKAPGRQMPWASELAAETKGTAEDAAEWQFTVTGGVEGEPVMLTWPELGRLPKDRVAILTDRDTGKRTFMRTRARYEFMAPGDGSSRSFAVTVKPAQQAGVLISSFSVVPLRGGGAELTFSLSADAAVSLEVLNVAGRLVQRIRGGVPAEAGRHMAAWNGRSLSGAALPNGLYLCVLMAKAPDGQQARAVRPISLSR